MMTLWQMHGYAIYIWPTYGLVVAVLVGGVWRAWWQARQVRLRLKRWLFEQ